MLTNLPWSFDYKGSKAASCGAAYWNLVQYSHLIEIQAKEVLETFSKNLA